MIEAIAKVLDALRGALREGEEKADQALAAIYTALNETRIYAGRLNRTARKYEDEEQLSRLWLKAAIAVRRYDENLAEACLLNGTYWASPTIGVTQYAEKHGAELEKLFESVRELMKELA